MWLPIVIGVLTGYLLGNLNGAVSISTLMKDDVRSHGSGNAGLTNFIRNYGNTKARYVVAVDALKAVLSCLVSGFLLKPYGMYMEGVMIGGAAVIVAGLAVYYFTSRCPNCKKFIRNLSSTQEEDAHCNHCGETFDIKD